LGWISIEELSKRLPPEVAKAGLSLAKEGEISAPVAAEDGFYLLRLVGRRGPILRPLDEVRPQIEHELILESKRRSERAWAEESRSGLRIRIDEEVLGRVKQPIPAPPPAPPRPMLQP
jgi:parvulin-like peptidyl-prolyl isomerase